MNIKYTTEDKLEYLQYKVDHDDSPLSEKIEIHEFLGYYTGLYTSKLGPDEFNKILDRLTRDLHQNPYDN